MKKGCETQNQAIIFVKYDPEGRPFSITTADIIKPITEGADPYVRFSDYNFDWCDRNGKLYWHNTGSGPDYDIQVYGHSDDTPARYWAAEGVEVKEHANAIRLDEPLPGLSAIFEECCECDGTEYCEVCEDWFPDDDVCRHLFFLDEIGDYGGCGCDDGDWEKHKESFLNVLARLPIVAELRAALNAHDYSITTVRSVFGVERIEAKLCGKYFFDPFQEIIREDDYSCQAGGYWLLSLDAGKTDKADDLTVQWIDEWLESKRKRREEAELVAAGELAAEGREG